MIRTDLAAELYVAGMAVRVPHFKALERLGVLHETLCDRWRHDFGFGVGLCADAGDGLYHPGQGDPHVIVPVFENGDLIDLCAFRSGTPNEWLLRTGMGWALGVERGFERHTWHDATDLATSPLEWLRHGAHGLCILDWDAPEVFDLAGIRHLVCSSEELAARLRTSLARPVRFPTISVGEMALAA